MGREREEWRERGMNRWREGWRRGITVKGGRESGLKSRMNKQRKGGRKEGNKGNKQAENKQN